MLRMKENPICSFKSVLEVQMFIDINVINADILADIDIWRYYAYTDE